MNKPTTEYSAGAAKYLRELDGLSNQLHEHFADSDLTLYDSLYAKYKEKQANYSKLFPNN